MVIWNSIHWSHHPDYTEQWSWYETTMLMHWPRINIWQKVKGTTSPAWHLYSEQVWSLAGRSHLHLIWSWSHHRRLVALLHGVSSCGFSNCSQWERYDYAGCTYGLIWSWTRHLHQGLLRYIGSPKRLNNVMLLGNYCRSLINWTFGRITGLFISCSQLDWITFCPA